MLILRERTTRGQHAAWGTLNLTIDRCALDEAAFPSASRTAGAVRGHPAPTDDAQWLACGIPCLCFASTLAGHGAQGQPAKPAHDVRRFFDDPESKVETAKPVVDGDHGRIETRIAARGLPRID
jgi:hypothetical protein